MTINFDVISDLYLNNVDGLDWSNKVTSLFCLVAGNITSNHAVLKEFLAQLSTLYRGVFYIDGDLEHDEFGGEFYNSYKSLSNISEDMDNVFFLHENIVVLEHVVIVGSNGWTSFDFVDEDALEESIKTLVNSEAMSSEAAMEIFKMSVSDTQYLGRSIASCQTMDEVKEVVVITNTIPRPDLVKHNVNYQNTLLGNTCGNSSITGCLDRDSNSKVKTWVFGRYPYEIDQKLDGIRYLSNPGIGKDIDIYYPKIVKF